MFNNNKKKKKKKKKKSSQFKINHWNNVNIMCGHPNQSGHITSFTAKCKLVVNSKDPDKQTCHSEDSSVPSLLITK